ncbi:hypothetical protein CBL_11486 [Carabus blaptoides fortunei]
MPGKIRTMSVKNCAQVFSRTVFVSVHNLLREMPSPDIYGLTPRPQGTANLIKFLDELFDSVNGSRGFGEQNDTFIEFTIKFTIYQWCKQINRLLNGEEQHGPHSKTCG